MNDKITMCAYGLVVQYRDGIPAPDDDSIIDEKGFFGYDDCLGQRYYFFLTQAARKRAIQRLEECGDEYQFDVMKTPINFELNQDAVIDDE